MKALLIMTLFFMLAGCKYEASYFTDIDQYQQARRSLLNSNYKMSKRNERYDLEEFSVSHGPYKVEIDGQGNFIGLVKTYIEVYPHKKTCLFFYKKENLIDDIDSITEVKKINCNGRKEGKISLADEFSPMSEEGLQTFKMLSHKKWKHKLYAEYYSRAMHYSQNAVNGMREKLTREEFLRYQSLSFDFDSENSLFSIQSRSGGNLYARELSAWPSNMPIRSLQQKIDSDGTIHLMIWANPSIYLAQEARSITLATMSPAVQKLKDAAKELLFFDEPGIMDGMFYKVKEGFTTDDLSPNFIKSYALIISYNPNNENEISVTPFMNLGDKTQKVVLKYYLDTEIGYNNF